MKSDGWLVEYVIPGDVERFRRGRGLHEFDWTKTPWSENEGNGETDASSS